METTPMSNMLRRHLLGVLLAAAAAGCGAGPPADSADGGDAALPSLTQLDTGWHALEPGGETTCALGGEFSFFVRPGRTDRLLVYLYGGGACWTGEDCDPEGSPTYFHQIEGWHDPATQSGIFDVDHPDNPFGAWSMVSVPYCTGDVHLGDRTATYTLEGEDGGTRELVIHHRGQANALAVMRWIRANFDSPDVIVVTGVSAGAWAVPFYADYLARSYPDARVEGLGDGAGGYAGLATRDDGGARVAASRWGFTEGMRRHPGWDGVGEWLSIVDLYTVAGEGAPNLRLYQFDHARDPAVAAYVRLAGSDSSDVYTNLRANRRTIRSRVPDFRGYTGAGTWHGILTSPVLYRYRTGSWRLIDWIAAIAEGSTVPDVECTDCTLPELIYTAEDLRVIDRAIEILSAPGAWDDEDEPRPCPERPEPERYSLRCAVQQAFEDVVGAGSPATSGAVWEVQYRLAAWNGDNLEPTIQGVPIWHRYNNADGRTVDEVVGLLEAARARIRAGLEGRHAGTGDR